MKKPRKKPERNKTLPNNISNSEKTATLNTNMSTTDPSKSIFKTIKIKNSRKKEENNEHDIKKLVRLYKNRISAKKCRQKRKAYIEALEKKVNHLEQELLVYENIKKNNLMENFLEEVNKYFLIKLNKKENEIILNCKSKVKILRKVREK